MQRTFNKLCEEMLQEWFGERMQFKKVFDSSKCGDPITDFHRQCDKSGRTVTIFYASGDSIFGGYTSQDWQPGATAGPKRDTKAFLFKLYDQRIFLPKKYPVEHSRYAIYCDKDCGPTFGIRNDLRGDIETKRKVPTPRTLSTMRDNFTVTTCLGQTYSSGKISNEDFKSKSVKVIKFEVIQVIDDAEYIEKAWRNVTDVSVDSLKRYLQEFEPWNRSLDHLKILLVGQIGAGKSSYINSVVSAFKGHVSSSVCTGSATTSLTLKNDEHRVLTWPERKTLKFRFWDTKGFEQPVEQSLIDDICHIIKGRPPGRVERLTKWMSSFWYKKRPPTQSELELLQEKVHCIAFMIDGSVLSVLPRHIKEAFEAIKTLANACDIPQMVLLTKIDKVCPMVDKHVSLTFHSKTIQDNVDQAAEMMGLPRSHVCPIKNYEQECELEEDVDRLVLLSLRQMLWFADDRLNNYYEV